MKTAQWRWLSIAVLGEVVMVLFRALRFRHFLEPIQSKAPLVPLVRAQAISFAASYLSPGRPGEILRPTLVSRWMKIPFASVAAITALERFFDLLALGIFGFFGFSFLPVPGTPKGRAWAFAMKEGVGGLTLILILLIALAWIVLRRHGDPQTWGEHPFWTQRPMFRRIGGWISHIVKGMASFRKRRTIFLLVLDSFCVWAASCLSVASILMAFGLHPTVFHVLVLTLVISLGMGIPTPGGIGGTHEAFVVGLTLFMGAPLAVAQSAGILGHLVLVLPLTLWGGYYALRMGIRNPHPT